MVAETFQEMLQRDFGYKLYKALLALPEKEEPPEAKNPDSEKGIKSEKEVENEVKEEPHEKAGAEDIPDSNQKEVQVSLHNSLDLSMIGRPLRVWSVTSPHIFFCCTVCIFFRLWRMMGLFWQWWWW